MHVFKKAPDGPLPNPSPFGKGEGQDKSVLAPLSPSAEGGAGGGGKSLFSPFLLLFLALLPSYADGPVAPRESPPALANVPTEETERIRIVNAASGAVQVSLDKGATWRLVGRVTAPATESLMGYLASGYSQPGTIAATAVHGLRVRVGDRSHAYAALVNILPAEFSSTPVRFGGHVSGLSGIYTNIPTGTAIFRDLAPYAGSPVFVEGAGGRLSPLPTDYMPQEGDALVIEVLRPVVGLKDVTFENRAGGDVRATYTDGKAKVIAQVIKPVSGVGRFDGTSYTGVGAVNTNHAGVVTVSTAPISTSPFLEGTGDERRGGFQIEPAYHNSQTDEAGAPSILVVGHRDKKRVPDLEGTPPLFHGYIDLQWNPADVSHSWVAQIQKTDGGPFLPMPPLVGNQPLALLGVRAVRVVLADAGDSIWRAARLQAAVNDYAARALKRARAGRTKVVRGQIVVSASASDARTQFMTFRLDGQAAALSNTAPFTFRWDTTSVPDGEYALESVAQDGDANSLFSTRTVFFVDNKHQVTPQTALPPQ